MSVIDLPPGVGLLGTPLGSFGAPRRAVRLALVATVVSIALGVLTWYLATRHWWRRGTSAQLVLPLAFIAFSLLGLAVRRARLAITRDGVRWGWSGLGFHQSAAQFACAHVYRDGVALEARRGSWWFLAARDWDRFEVMVRQLRRAELPVADHDRTAPLRARIQSYGRFLDALLLLSIAGSVAVTMWAA